MIDDDGLDIETCTDASIDHLANASGPSVTGLGLGLMHFDESLRMSEAADYFGLTIERTDEPEITVNPTVACMLCEKNLIFSDYNIPPVCLACDQPDSGE